VRLALSLINRFITHIRRRKNEGFGNMSLVDFVKEQVDKGNLKDLEEFQKILDILNPKESNQIYIVNFNSNT
jgi:hypothetical protein